ncbi:putative membrane protein [Gottschalkia acidurici 9a]|uniref:Membrane protein n=2 Tax=Clostridium acidurici TaxID=1556 RepID=K0B0A3_GOTA9|nr:putative membrane protein [Gottschalkia acidurici 9a]
MILIYMGLLLIILGTVLGNSLVLKLQEINGKYGMEKVIVNIKDLKTNKDGAPFTLEDIKNLKDIFKNSEITFSSYNEVDIEDVTNVRLIGTNYNYTNFNNVKFNKGYFFNKKDEELNEKIVVIDEKLAWKAFGSIDVLGKEIYILEEKFKIVGIKSHEKMLEIYMPLESLLKIDECTRISHLEIKTSNSYTTKKNIEDMENALKLIGKHPDDYNIYDYNIKSMQSIQKPRIIMFLLGTISIIITIKFAIYMIRDLYSFILRECKEDYLVDVLKRNIRKVVNKMLYIIIIILSVFIIWNIVKFNIYIPKEYISEEIISIKFLFNLLSNILWEGFLDTSYIISLQEIKLNIILKILSFVFYISIFIGIPLIYIGFYQLKLKPNLYYKNLKNLNLFFCISYALVLLLAYILKLPIFIDIKGLGIILLFVYLNFVHKQYL